MAHAAGSECGPPRWRATWSPRVPGGEKPEATHSDGVDLTRGDEFVHEGATGIEAVNGLFQGEKPPVSVADGDA